jgi:hypothetical protein
MRGKYISIIKVLKTTNYIWQFCFLLPPPPPSPPSNPAQPVSILSQAAAAAARKNMLPISQIRPRFFF